MSTDADAALAAQMIVSAVAAEALGTPTAAPVLRSSRRAARLERIATGDQRIVAAVVSAPATGIDEPVLLDDVVVEIDPVIDVVPAVDVEAPADKPAVEAEAEAEASAADEFEAAARLFSFTGETPVQAAAVQDEAPAQAEDQAAHVAPRRRRRGIAFKRVATASFSVGVFGIVGLLAVGMTTPAAAVAAVGGAVDTTNLTAKSSEVVTAAGSISVDPAEIQAYVTPSDIQNATLDRSENYVTASMADLAADFAIARPSDFYVNDMSAAIQWPFAVGVAITWGFVWRDGRQHQGADFVPGEGAHVQSIADGTVRIATENGGGFGVTVLIDHIVDGELVSSRYAHMLNGSLQVKPGDTVTVGQYLGRTGDTGHSFGAHTHFEILAGGTTPIDPIAWLRQNAGRDSLG